MLPDRVSNPGPLTYESGVLPIALRGPAHYICTFLAMMTISVLIYQVNDFQHEILACYLIIILI